METILQLRASTTTQQRKPKYFTSIGLVPGFILNFLLFWFCGPLLRHADPAAAVVDLGVLSLLLLALLALLFFICASLWLSELLWPVFREYRKVHFGKNFKCLSPAQKIVVYLVTFFLFLLAFVFCLLAVV